MASTFSLRQYVADSLKALRKKRDYRQGTLAHRLGMSLRHLQKIEAGEIDVKVNTLSLFAQALDVPPCHLLSHDAGGLLQELDLICPSEILDLLHIGVHIFSPEGRILYCNRRNRENLGLMGADLRQPRYIWEFLYDRADVPKTKEYFKTVVETQPEPKPFYTRHRY